MNARELLAVIRAAGGTITLLDSAIETELPGEVGHLMAQVEHSRDSIRAVIESEQPGFLQSCFRPSAKLDGRKLKKLIRTIQDRGGVFTPAGRLFSCSLPDELICHENAIRTNAPEIRQLLWPVVKSSLKKRRTCEICGGGSGCRQRGGLVEEQACPLCGHSCRSHHAQQVYPDIVIAAGCHRWSAGAICNCPGFPAEAAKTKRKEVTSSMENSMALFTPEQLAAAREKYEQEQLQLHSQRPKTHAEILIEIVREDPTLTVAELAEAAARSHSWVRKVLAAAGLKAAGAPRTVRAATAPTAPPTAPLLEQKGEAMSEPVSPCPGCGYVAEEIPGTREALIRLIKECVTEILYLSFLSRYTWSRTESRDLCFAEHRMDAVAELLGKEEAAKAIREAREEYRKNPPVGWDTPEDTPPLYPPPPCPPPNSSR